MSRGISARVNFWWLLTAVALLVEVPCVKSHSCHEVKTAFQLRQIGSLKLVPETPATDVDLQICKHQGPTCCTRRMEDSYQAAVRRDALQYIRSYSFELEYLFVNHRSALQDTFQSLVSFSTNHIISLLDASYEVLAEDAHALVSRLFSDLSVFVLGGNATVHSAVNHFYDSLFPLMYGKILSPGPAEQMAERSECLRAAYGVVEPFGGYPEALVESLAHPLLAARELRRVLAEGAEVLNATQNMAMSRDCNRALVRMQYCSHCRGLTLIRPCEGYCLNVMRGCLADLAEFEGPWKRYLALLVDLSGAMAGDHNLELALLGVRTQISEAIQHAQLHAYNISATVEKVCGQPRIVSSPRTVIIETTSVTSSVLSSASEALTSSESPAHSPLGRLTHMSPPSPSLLPATQRLTIPSSLPLKPSKNDSHRSMRKICREFIRYVQRYKTFFTALPDMLCNMETIMDDFACWSRDGVVESYVGRIVGSGLRAQRFNPEVKVRHADPVLAEVKEKLENFVQVVRNSTPGLSSGWVWDDSGSGGPEGSSDCDDEDGCQGSGDNPTGMSEDKTKESGMSKEMNTEVNAPKRTSTVRPRMRGPMAAGSSHTGSVALLAFSLFLSDLGLRWVMQ